MAAPTTLRPAPARRVQPPKSTRLTEWDLAWVLGAFATVVTGIWVVHGGLAGFGDGTSGAATAITQLSGLYASSMGLLGLVLVARPSILERRYGLDRLFNWHRVLGEAMAVLIGVHVAAGIVSWQIDGQWGAAIADLTGRQPYFAGATVGALLIGVVTVSSLRSVRNRLSYETWYFLHLAAYLGFALSFGHMIVEGSDFADDSTARWAWVLLHVAVAVMLVIGRWGRVISSTLRPLRVVEVRRVSPDACTVRLSGRRLHAWRGASGQFCFLRPMTRDGWWHSNPYSLSAAPTVDELRFTVKERGDASARLLSLRPGARVAVDGPYGVCTPEVFDGRKVLFVVGGVGIAPVRALLEDLPAGCEPVVLYRAHRTEDLLHVDELDVLTARHGGRVLQLVGPSATLAVRDPFSPAALRRAVPDVADRIAILCGPDRLLQAARAGLTRAGVDRDDIHYEHAWW